MLRETFPEVKHSDARVVVSPVPPLPTTTVHSSPRGLILACINKLANSPYKRADSIAIRNSIKTDCPSPSNPICDQYAEHY